MIISPSYCDMLCNLFIYGTLSDFLIVVDRNCGIVNEELETVIHMYITDFNVYMIQHN